MMKTVILTLISLGSILDGRAQLAPSQHFTTTYGQTAFTLPKGAKLYQNTMLLGNHVQFGLTNTTSIGIGACPIYFKQTGFQVFSAVNVSHAFNFNEREALRVGAIGGIGYAPNDASTSDFGGLFALYSRKITDFDLATLGYGYYGSSIYYPPHLHQFSLNYKRAFKNSRLGLEVGAVVGWSQSNWGFEDWGTIWRVVNWRPTLVLTKKFDGGNSVFLGISGLTYAEWTPSDGSDNYRLMWPTFGYSRYF
jgi:hypothetical protein